MVATSVRVSQRRELHSESRENSLEITQHDIVPRVPQCIAVHLHYAHARQRVDHVIGNRISGDVNESMYGAEKPVKTVFVVVLDAFKLSFVGERLVDR